MKLWGPMTLILAMSLVACAKKEDETDVTESDDGLAPLIEAQESQKIEVDATNRTEWVGLDLDTGALINAQELPLSTDWDLAFKRTSIKMEGKVSMQRMELDFSALTTAPQDGYQSDKPSTEPGAPETTGLVFHTEPSWYSYDSTTHAVSSRGISYVIRSNKGRFFKLKIHDYYNAARLPAYINLEFQELKGTNP